MPRRRYQCWTAKERAFVVAHYGPTAREPWLTGTIAKALGRVSSDVRAAARRWGLAHRKLVLTRYKHAWMQRLYDEGLDDGWISLVVGCNRMTVCRWRKRNGLAAVKWGYGRPRPIEPRPPIGKNEHRDRRRGS